MWHSQGSITATNNNTVVTGVGTGFLQGVRVGDGIAIAGSASLHEVVSVASNTQLTIKPAYAGTTGAGKQYSVAPILGYDKDLSDAFNQLRLQFGDQLTNLQPWVDDVTTQFNDTMVQFNHVSTQFDDAIALIGDVESVLVAINGEP